MQHSLLEPQFHSLCLCKTHLVSLVADGHAVSAVHDVVFTVVPQQAVGDRAEELLSPPGHLVPVQSRLAAHFVHVVDQDLRSVGEIRHTVHPHAGNFGDDAQQQAVICDHPGDGGFVLGDDRQDVRDEMSHAVVSEVDAKMSEQRPGNFQQVTSFVKGQVVFGFILLLLFGRRKEEVEELVEEHDGSVKAKPFGALFIGTGMWAWPGRCVGLAVDQRRSVSFTGMKEISLITSLRTGDFETRCSFVVY